MKPKKICILVSFLFSFTTLNAKEVEPANVKEVALNVFSNVAGIDKNQVQVAAIIPVTANGDVVYTIFNLIPRGHIVISNDDAVEPVLGYGLDSHIDFKNIPSG